MPLPDELRESLALWLRLTLTPGISAGTVRALLARFGLPEDIFAAGRTRLATALDARRAHALLADDEERAARAAAALRWADEGDDHQLLAIDDVRYPRALLSTADPPVLLYVLGSPAALSGDLLAIVGARQATPAGAANAHAWARYLSDEGLTVVSGLAHGIDAAAHRGALEGGATTVAVIGTGIDRVYPAANHALARDIAARGAIVSEFPLGTGVRRAHFPQRNRILAGLSLGVLVVEAARRSGSLTTARLAGEYGREVMAVPGSIHSPVAHGCHWLIRQGAVLVESAEDVMAEIRPRMSAARTAEPLPPEQEDDEDHEGAGDGGAAGEADGSDAARRTGAAQTGLSRGARQLLDACGHDPVTAEELARRCALAPADLAAALLELELAGCLTRAGDGSYWRA